MLMELCKYSSLLLHLAQYFFLTHQHFIIDIFIRLLPPQLGVALHMQNVTLSLLMLDSFVDLISYKIFI